MARDSYHHGNLREALVQAGLELLTEHGPAGLSLRGCAARVGVSHSAPKNHFPSLESLQAAIVAEGFLRQHAAMSDALASAGPAPGERILAACDGYLRFAEANPDLFRLMFSTDRWSRNHPEVREAADAACSVLREVAAAMTAGHGADPMPPSTAEIMVRSFVHGFASLAINDQFRRAVEETGRTPSLAEAMP
jgi:AcrR family transcriptional regulator